MDFTHLNELQKAQLSIFKEVVKVCERHSLNYYAYGGTLLGAYRHKGFIPWDDDIDITMPRKDYEKFMSYLDELPSYLRLDTIKMKGHNWMASQLMDTRMTIRLGNSKQRPEMNVWIDILILDGVPNPHTIGFMFWGCSYLALRLLYKFSHFSSEVDLKMKRPWYESLCVKFALYTHVEKIISQSMAGKLFDWFSRRYDYDKCEYVSPLGGILKLKEIYPKKWFGDGRMLQFEDMQIKGLTETEKYFLKFYGPTYMTPPPENERYRHNVEIIKNEIK